MRAPSRASAGAARNSAVAVLGVSALGVVFGDIGTSPLYTLKTVLQLSGDARAPVVVLGTLSLVIWTLILITTIKYVNVAMRINNDGEGGVLALMALLGIKRHHRPAIVIAGLFGAALIYGDGAITPAISVLSALEGLNIALPSFKPYVVPASVAILIGLFAIQPLGTARIGRAFGPVMALWFLAIAALGAWGVAQHPAVLVALNPVYGLRYLLTRGYAGFVVLGGVFLCVTGAEALYADMGHFGARPIRLAWNSIVFPSLVLNYAGQGALVLEGAPTSDNIFFRLCPAPLVVPLVVLATVATIIASQSIITGAFSMTRQAIQLGWLPRLRIRQTSEEHYGQIYVGAVNWLLMFVTVGLTVWFGSSDNLAAAYGIAVSMTMLTTSVLLFIAMRDIWGWSIAASGALAGAFIALDGAFVAANLTKVAEGGYVPLLLALVIFALMMIWHRGAHTVAAALGSTIVPLRGFLAEVDAQRIPRVPGTAIFLTRTMHGTPPVMRWHVKQNRALHQNLLVLTVQIESVPRIRDNKRLSITEAATGYCRAAAHYGFMERPDLPALLRSAPSLGCRVPLDDVTYYVGHETIMHSEQSPRLPRWQEVVYAAMARNSVHITDFYRLPLETTVEIGRQVAI
jgi:KUP system potassium uptake protein